MTQSHLNTDRIHLFLDSVRLTLCEDLIENEPSQNQIVPLADEAGTPLTTGLVGVY